MFRNKKIYLVDTENVGKKWMLIIPELKKHDEIILFYTDFPINYKLSDIEKISECKKINFIHCFNGSANALDFQLTAMLGYMSKNNKKCEYIIVSDDSGYDAIIKFMRTIGVNVSRMLMKVSAKEINDRELEYVNKNIVDKINGVETADDLTINVSSTLQLSQSQTKHIVKIIRSVLQSPTIMPENRLVIMHNRLVQKYGESGKEYYRKLKSSGILTRMQS